MGSSLSTLTTWWNGDKIFKIIMIGLDAAGKTTILYRLVGKDEEIVPSTGFNLETVHYKNYSFNIWDVAGQGVLKTLWRCYYDGSDAVIFVVDSSDRERLDQVKTEIDAIKSNDILKNAKILIYANKQDFSNALSVSELGKELDLREDKCFIQPTIGLTGEGLTEGLEWLHKNLEKPVLKNQRLNLGK